VTEIGETGSALSEASVTLVVLRGCPACGHKHPLACSPPMPADICPGCGGPAVPPREPVLVGGED
jgi:rRNA maturation endonuclease Nob1